MNPRRLPAEWEPQAFVQLTWPHEATDWNEVLPQVEACYQQMAAAICQRVPLLIVASPQCGNLPTYKYNKVCCPTNDTWARDHAFITCLEQSADGQQHRLMLDFQFNGWGMKFAANHDNQINQAVWEQRAEGLFGNGDHYENHLDFVLEGGSIESDGRGTILTTVSCLLAPNRNEPMSQQQIEDELKRRLGADRVLWLHHGHLEGDDTDGHIDTLARLCPDDTIAYVRCDDPADSHYEDLAAMEAELAAFRTTDGKPYRLVPLPMPAPIYDDEGQRLPATYANFLITNQAVLYPTYRQPSLDLQAARQLRLAFPRHDIVPIDCSVLILQHGSLHCSAMQVPQISDRL